ncbi:hypothetical protein [Variovorax atrisoli]|uniref:hypothetical protein n=1 Tax=Variovorax atrisoli TaxID=3394203 RepID=UPI00036F1919|nr:hypothetical protein [Variovorax paradoxus]
MDRLDQLEARVTALEETVGALTMLAIRQMQPERRQQFAEGIGAMAQAAEKAGRQASAQLLTQLHGAAAMAALP